MGRKFQTRQDPLLEPILATDSAYIGSLSLTQLVILLPLEN